MTKIKKYSYKRKGKLVKVPGHDRRTYKGYRHKPHSPSRSLKADRSKKAKYRPRKTYRKGLGNKGDW